MGFEQDNIYPMVSPTPEFSNFIGGYKYSESLLDLAMSQSPDCKNCYWRIGALWQLDGSEKLDASPITGSPAVRGLFSYGQESSGTTYLLAATGNKVWRYSGGWADITGAITLTAASQHFGLTFNDIFIGVTSARDAPYKKDGAADLQALGGTPPSGKVIGRIGEFIVIGNTAAAPSYAYYCNAGNPEAGWDKYWDVKSDDTQGLTAVGSLDQRSGYLFKQRTADRIEHLGGLSFQHDRMYLSVGIVAQGTLKRCSMFRDGRSVDVLVGLGESGVFAFDHSNNPYKLSENISFKFDRNNSSSWSRTYWSKAVAEYDSTRNWYWLWAPSHDSTGNNDELWICDLNSLAWWPADPDDSASICVVNDSNGYPQMYCGGYDGYVRKFGQDVKNYDGSAINSYFVTSPIDFKKTVRVRQFIPYAATKGAWNLDFSFRWGLSQVVSASDTLRLTHGGDYYGTGVYGTATYGSSKPRYKNLAALNKTGRYLQIKMGNARVDENWNLFKLEIPCRIIGGLVGEYR